MVKRKNIVATAGTLIVLGLAFVVGMSAFSTAQEKISLTIWTGSATAIRREIDLERIKTFMQENPNIKLEESGYPETVMRDKLFPAIAAGIPPNIVHALPEQETFMVSGICVPMPVDLKEFIRENDYNADSYYDVDGEYYSFSTGVDSPTYFYNVDLWEADGLSEQDIPETWSELREIAGELTRYDSEGVIVRAGFGFNKRTNGLFYDLLFQLGGHMWSRDGRTCVANSPEGIKAWEFLSDLIFVDKVNAPDFLEYKEAFGMGKSVITWCFSWFAGFLEANYPDIKYGKFINPLPDDRAFGSPNFWSYGRSDTERTFLVLHSTKEKEEASWKFMEALYKDNKSMQAYADLREIIPVKKELADLPKYQQGWYKMRRRLFLNTIFAPVENVMYFEKLVDAEHSIVREGRPIKEVLDRVAKETNEYLETQPYFVGRDKYEE